MIKQLILAAALVVPGLASAGDPSADLSIQVVPASPPGSIACDQGPNAAAIPAPAQKAGYTHCLLNADFTSAAYANPANWLAECGASAGSLNAVWHLLGNHSTQNGQGAAIFELPCNRAIMTNDNGTQVFDMRMLTTDPTSANFNIMVLDWPGNEFSSNGGGPNHTGLQHNMYSQITYRITPGSLAQFYPGQVPGNFFLPMAWWYTSCGNFGCPIPQGRSFVEVDFFELFASTCTVNGGTGNDCTPGFNTAGNPGTIWTTLNMSGYNTEGHLYTSSNGINFSACVFNNSDIATATPSGGGCASGAWPNTDIKDGVATIWINDTCGFKDRNGNPDNYPPGCLVNNVDIYFKNIQIWGCPDYWNSICNGTVVTGIEAETKFGWLRRKINDVLGRIVPSANAGMQ